MKKPSKAEVIAYMRAHLADFVGPYTNKLHHTILAEHAAFHFNAYEHGFEIPEEFFDWAIEAGDQSSKEAD